MQEAMKTPLPINLNLEKVYPELSRHRQIDHESHLYVWLGNRHKERRVGLWVKDRDIADRIEKDIESRFGNRTHVLDTVLSTGNRLEWHPDRYVSQYIRFQAEHFRPGTQFVCDDLDYTKRTNPTVYTAVSVSCNGAGSWVINTDHFSEIMDDYDCIHVDHVTRIIKPGNSPMIYRYYPDGDPSFVTKALALPPEHNGVLDWDTVWGYLSYNFGLGYYHHVGRVKSPALKKRIVKALRQNLNRFLIPVKQARAREHDEHEAMVREMHEADNSYS